MKDFMIVNVQNTRGHWWFSVMENRRGDNSAQR
jgi:hypothetical protein